MSKVKTLPKRSDVKVADTWDLSSLVASDAAWEKSFSDFEKRDSLKRAEAGVFLDSAHGIPHYRIKVNSKWHHDAPDFNPIFDVVKDPTQQNPIRDKNLESQLAGKMKELMERYDAPACQYPRMGL